MLKANLINTSSNPIFGKGKKIYVVVDVDQADPEDTSTEIWLADSEEHLYEQVKSEFVGDEPSDMENEALSRLFELEWGQSVLYKEIGEAV